MSGEGEGGDGLACEPDDEGPDGESPQAARKALTPMRHTAASVLRRPHPEGIAAFDPLHIANLEGKQLARQTERSV
jgi:hypothetical protein